MNYRGYPEYQKSKAVWLGRIPSHWKVHRLKWSVTGCSNGVWGTEPDGIDDVVCVRVADFNRENLTVDIDSLTNRAVEPNQFATRKVQRGDLLLEKSGGGEKQLVGCVVYFDHDFNAVCSNFVARMPVEPMLSARYWCYVHAGLYAGKLNYPAIKQSTGIQNLDANEYLNTLVAYPPVDEQKQIAAFLDWKTSQIDALIAKKKELMEKLKEKRLAVITQAVTKGIDLHAPMRDSNVNWLQNVPAHWLVRRLKFNVSKVGSGVTPKGGAEGYEASGIPLLRSQNIHFDELRLDDVVFISEDTHSDMVTSQVASGDVLLNITGASIGRCHFVTEDLGEANVNQHVCIVRPESELLTKYLYFALYSDIGQLQINLEQGGSGREGLNFVAIKNFILPLPKVQEQQKIVVWLEVEVEKLKSLSFKVESAIANLSEYRTALITAATTGKIDVRGWQGTPRSKESP